jgi:hypothetical protein
VDAIEESFKNALNGPYSASGAGYRYHRGSVPNRVVEKVKGLHCPHHLPVNINKSMHLEIFTSISLIANNIVTSAP